MGLNERISERSDGAEKTRDAPMQPGPGLRGIRGPPGRRLRPAERAQERHPLAMSSGN